MSEPQPHILILSPHRDDAAFSCGLLLHHLLQANSSVSIVNICTTSKYAPYLTLAPSLGTWEVSEARRQEDLHFLQRVGKGKHSDATVQCIDLDWLDLPLRWNVRDHIALEPLPLHPEEITDLQTAFSVLPIADVVLAPAAIGGHLDHRLVRHAAETAFRPSQLVLYEDLPYACTMDRTGDTALSPETWTVLGKPTPHVKREFCLCYPSQIDEALADTMDRYGQVIGGERYACPAESATLLHAVLDSRGAHA